jgi:putative membrane protein
MTRTRALLHVATIAIFAALPDLLVSAATREAGGESFLKTAAQGQQAEIALGQLATQKASNPDVKQFGAQMIEDHQKASQEVRQLASKEGVRLPMQLSEKHKHKQQELSKLSGEEFDRAYMQYMVQDHTKEVKEFEQNAEQITDQDVKKWASSAVPVLKEHLQKAQTIAASIGVGVQ